MTLVAFSLLSVQCNWNFSSGHVASVTREQTNLYLFTCLGVNRGIKKRSTVREYCQQMVRMKQLEMVEPWEMPTANMQRLENVQEPLSIRITV